MSIRTASMIAARAALALTYISLFSGVEGAGLGLEMAGARCVGRCEIDRQASDVLRFHDQETPNWRDVSAMQWLVRNGYILRADFPHFIWMSPPCQDLSVAGKRKGLKGSRSGLFYDAIRFIRTLVGRGWRGIVLMEQVPGLLSSNEGRDFAEVLRSFQNLGAVDVGWRILDSQWFGVAQRRARLYFVVDLGGERVSEILALAQGLRGDPAPGRKTGQSPAGGASNGVGSGGGYGSDAAQDADLSRCVTTGGVSRQDGTTETFIPETVPPLRATGPGASRAGDSRGQDPVVACITTRPYCDRESQEANLIVQDVAEIWRQTCGGCGQEYVGPLDKRCPNCLKFTGGFTHGEPLEVIQDVAHTLRGEGFDASEDGTGRGTPIIPIQEPFTLAERGRSDGSSFEFRQDGLANALMTPSGGRGGLGCGAVCAPLMSGPSYAISMRGRGDDGRGYDRPNHITEDVTGCLDTVKPFAICAPFDLRNVTSPDNRSRFEFGGPSGTLHSNPQHVALAFPWKNAATAGMPVTEVAPTMGSNRNSEPAVAFQPKYYSDRERQGGKPGDVCPTLTGNAADAGDNAPHVATIDDPKDRLFDAPVWKVRRTTPRENERLQGWYDDYTRWGMTEQGKVYEMADGPRYRFCGNGVTANVSEWICRRLVASAIVRKELAHVG